MTALPKIVILIETAITKALEDALKEHQFDKNISAAFKISFGFYLIRRLEEVANAKDEPLA